MRRAAIAILAVFSVWPSAPTLGDTHYVSKAGTNTYPYDTWATAADTVACAVEAATEWDTILIAPGHYVSGEIRMKPGQLLRGSGVDSTIIDTFPASFPILAEDSCVLEDFTLRQSSTAYALSVTSPMATLGIRLEDDRTAIIERVRFDSIVTAIHLSFNDLSGAGNVCYIMDCEFLYPQNAIVSNSGNVDFRRCLFRWNSRANLGVIIADFSKLSISSCRFYGDDPSASISGAAAINTYRTDPIIIRNCLFYSTLRNPALQLNYQDGSSDSVSVGLVANNSFVRFLEHLLVDRPGFVFRNNISMWDQASSMAGSFYGGSVVGEYNITWDNSPWDSGVVRGGDTIPNDRPGNHDNQNVHPMFVDTIDFLLQAFSPAIDAGDPSILDLDGSRSDIGYTGGPGGASYAYIDLPPAVPKGFSDAGFQNAKQTLTWRRNWESDFARYELFRDVLPIESADSTLLRAVLTADTTYADTLEMPEWDYYYRLRAVDAQGNASGLSNEIWHIHAGVDEHEPISPSDFVLHPNYPNPFNAATRVTIDVPIAGRLDVMVYDVLGRRVESLYGATMPAGRYDLGWAPEDAGSGVYFIVAKFGGATRVGKMLLLK